MIKTDYNKYAERIVMTTFLSIFFCFILIFLFYLLKEKALEIWLLYGAISLFLSAIVSIFLITKVDLKYLYFENIMYICIYSFAFFLFLIIMLEATVPIMIELLNSKYLSKILDIK